NNKAKLSAVFFFRHYRNFLFYLNSSFLLTDGCLRMLHRLLLRDYTVPFTFTLPAGGYAWYVIE
ncbi:MAG: hypothetical protein ACOVOY_06110, partial [Sediminibacterium sp.]